MLGSPIPLSFALVADVLSRLWLALKPDSLPRILAYIGVAALLGALIAARFTPKPARAPAPGEDLLAEREAEEPAYLPPKTAPDPPKETAEPDPDLSALVVWDEREDVYRPAAIDAQSFVQTLTLKRTPEIKPDQAYIFIKRRAYEQIQAHLKRDMKIEQGGLLIGRALRDETLATYLLLIEEALPAHGAVETETTIEYTPEAWKNMLPQLQQMDAAWTVIGSYHSHPGHGVFLSSTDKDTQGEVFSQDWQVALVVDPVADKMGFFVGEKGKRCSHWYIADEAREE